MLIDALHAALEDRIVTLNRVRGDVTTNILFSAVVHRFMAGEVAAYFYFHVVASLIGHQVSPAADALYPLR
jgi:hypothetical protein